MVSVRSAPPRPLYEHVARILRVRVPLACPTPSHPSRLLPRLLPPRIAPPYGKPLTVVLDARVLQSPEAANGRRPGLDRFLGMLMGKYEVVVYGHVRLCAA